MTSERSQHETSEYEAIVYFKVGISGSAREAVSSFVIKVTDDTKMSDLEDDLSNKLSKAGLEVSAEFVPNLLHHLYDVMDETETHDKDQAEPGAGERPASD